MRFYGAYGAVRHRKGGQDLAAAGPAGDAGPADPGPLQHCGQPVRGQVCRLGPHCPVHRLSPSAADDRPGGGHRRGHQHGDGRPPWHWPEKAGCGIRRGGHPHGPCHVAGLCRDLLVHHALLCPGVLPVAGRHPGRGDLWPHRLPVQHWAVFRERVDQGPPGQRGHEDPHGRPDRRGP